MNSNGFSTPETLAIIAIAVIAVSIAGLFLAGSAVQSTGGYITNSTNGTFLFGWATPIGASLIGVGKSWVQTAITVTYTLAAAAVVAVLVIFNKH